VSIAHSGFAALNNYIGKPDIFGRIMQMTKANVADALAESAVAVMGEGSEQTPLALIEDLPFVRFQKRNPTPNELNALSISMDNDLYAPLLTRGPWKKGRR
jgi:F420-0:gamma-glutamyl ligase